MPDEGVTCRQATGQVAVPGALIVPRTLMIFPLIRWKKLPTAIPHG